MPRPLGDRVFIRREELPAEEVRDSGLVIPETAREPAQRGEVVAVGKGASDVAEGDVVLFGKYSGTPVVVDGEDLLVMHETDILGVVS